MSRFQVYIKPFDDSGNYQDYIEVTKDVASIGNIKQTIDSDEFNTGIYRFDSFNLTLNNYAGLYSDVGGVTSIFKFKRSGSLVKVTWSFANDITQCGIAICGADNAYTNKEQTIFEGLLNDESLVTRIGDQKANFKVLSIDSILSEVETNYGSISNGESVDTILYTILNQTKITTLLSVSASNISSNLNSAVDDVSVYENQTVEETVKDLLGLSNSVLYIIDNTIYISDRTPGAAISRTFYGQASDNGIENITDINNLRSGLNKVFNLITWDDTTLSARDSSSITNYGVRKKNVSFDSITNNTTRQNILNNIRTEFGPIKQELTLTTPLDYIGLDLNILDRVAIDYPTPFRAAEGEELPILGQAILGEAVLPIGEWSFTIDPDTNYKILDKNIIIKSQQISYKLKEI